MIEAEVVSFEFDLEVDVLVPIHIATDVGLVLVLFEDNDQFAGVTGELRSDEGEGLVTGDGRIGVHTAQVDRVSVLRSAICSS